MRSTFLLISLFFATAVAAGDDDPGASHKAAMEAARRRAAQARKALEKALPEIEAEHPAFTARQAEYRAAVDERKALEKRVRAALDADPKAQALRADRQALDAKLREARAAGDVDAATAANKAKYRNHVALRKCRSRLDPEAERRLKTLGETTRRLLRRLVALARQDLAQHPELQESLSQLEAASTAAEREEAAMRQARGHVTPVEYLAALPAPRFRAGHTLPPLTRYGWVMPVALKQAFADRWGYAVPLGGYVTEKTVARLRDPESAESRTLALVESDPERYKLSVTCARHFPETPPAGTWTRDADGRLLNAKARSYDGTEWNPGMKTVISPLAPDTLWEASGRGRADPLAAIRKRTPISIVLNGGEFGIGVWGFAGKVWQKDPRIAAAIEEEGDWFAFLSKRKARAEGIIADAVRTAVPDRDLYIYYTCSGGGHRNRWPGWKAWCYDFAHLHPVSDLPSDEHYVNHFNSGWVGKQDVLSQALNSAGVQIALGKPLAYSWFWCKRRDESMRRYTGFLKCIYVMGTLGGNAGAYHQPDFEAGFKPEDPPYWLEQMVVLSRVHAFFSHLEDDLRNGELVPGPYRHAWTTENPAYELLPAELADTEESSAGEKVLKMGRPVRVLVRRHRTRRQALAVAWAADGTTRPVTVEIPGFGRLSLEARPGGSVYRLRREGKDVQLHRLDPDAVQPSLSLQLQATPASEARQTGN